MKPKTKAIMKIKFTRATTLRGKEVKPGDVAEVDRNTFQSLKSADQAELYVEPAKPAEPDTKKK